MEAEDYIEHEVRIRMLEQITAQINYKMNTGLILLISGILIPLLMRWIGAR